MKSLLICLVLVSVFSVGYSQTFCDKYVNITGLTGKQLVTVVVNNTVLSVIAPNNGILQYFNGTQPAGSTNYLTNPTALALLFNNLVSYFGAALGCSDGSITPYNGRSIKAAHATMGVNYFAYSKFNQLVADNVRNALSGLPGYSAADVTAVAGVLHTLKNDICNTTDCYTICNKYSIPFNLNNYALVSTVVSQAFLAINGSDLLKPFFNGTVPAGSTNYFTDAVAAANLANGLITFFGAALGCSDGSIGAYTGRSMRIAHANIPINNAVFTTFNGALASILGGLGVSQGDLAIVGAVLESTRADICNQQDCFPASTFSTVSNSAPVTTPQTTGQKDSAAYVFAPLVALVASLLFFF